MNIRKSAIVYAIVAVTGFAISVPDSAARSLDSTTAGGIAPAWRQVAPDSAASPHLVQVTGRTEEDLQKKYPYPDKAFVLTPEIWERTVKKIETGNPDWFDAEIVRQRAELEGNVVSMELLGWMYERGRGVKQDFRKAFLWYSRAEIGGAKEVRGNTYKNFQ